MEDMHIHLKNAIFSQEEFNGYVNKCKDCNLDRVVFLDHSNRISPKHKPVLNNPYAIDQLGEKINNYRLINKEDIDILKGIEIDYSKDLIFRDETYKILDYGNFEWVAGAIHSMKFEDETDYFRCILDLLDNYKINAVAHMRLKEDYKLYLNIIKDVLRKCYKNDVALEINTSDRSRWNDEQLYFMLGLMEQYDVGYVFGSDAHKVDDIGYMINEVDQKVREWKKKR